MEKYLLLLVYILLCVGANAEVKELTFGAETSDSGGSSWKNRDVTDAKENIQEGDFIQVSFDEVKAENRQYAITNTTGTKIIQYSDSQDWFDCSVGQQDFVFTVTKSIYDAIQSGGLQIQYNGLSNLEIRRLRLAENWNSYAPTMGSPITVMDEAHYIKDWYSGSIVLKTGIDYVGKTLRVVCLDTDDDSYAFLKKNDSGWPSLMSGSDKFSIAGWKFFEIKINNELNGVLRGNGLRIGGNNYLIAKIYVYGTDTSAADWTEEDADVVDTYTFTDAIGGADGSDAIVPGSFFEYRNNGTQISDEKIANTKNNVIRLIFEPGSYKANDGNASAQVSAKDAEGAYNAAYIRQRNTVGSGFEYVNYADCNNSDHYDFELSDAITVFELDDNNETIYNRPIVNRALGVKTGMLSSLLKNGMQIWAKNVKIKSVQIRKSMVSKYVTGRAEYKHNLSDQVWRPIALPYNLTQAQLKEAFGENVKICELGPSQVTKTVVENESVSNVYGITLNFQALTSDLNANYPYIIKLAPNTVHSDEIYYINNVKADVRDFQAYEFRTGEFDVSALNAEKPAAGSKDYEKNLGIYNFEQNIKTQLNGVYMIFQSTAPVFNITNTGYGDVEIINGVNQYTVLGCPSDPKTEVTNYYFSNGNLFPILTQAKKLKSGLAYVKFPAATYTLFNDTDHPAEVALSKLGIRYEGDDDVTGIEEVIALPKKKSTISGVYNLCGQLVRKGNSTEGLAQGIYIVDGKKVLVK